MVGWARIPSVTLKTVIKLEKLLLNAQLYTETAPLS